MPDNNAILLERIREQVALIDKNTGVPMHPQAKEALHIMVDFLQGVENIRVDDDQHDEQQDLAIQKIQGLLTTLEQVLQDNQSADQTDHADLLAAKAVLEDLKNRLATWETALPEKINGAVQPLLANLEALRQQEAMDREHLAKLEADLLALLQKLGNLPSDTPLNEVIDQVQAELSKINTALLALQRQDQLDDERITDLLSKITALEGVVKTLPTEPGLSAGQVQALLETSLRSLQEDIEKLQAHDEADDSQFKAIFEKIAALKEQLDHTSIGDGLTRAQVQTLVEELLLALRSDVQQLQEQIKALQDKFGQLPTGNGLTEAQVQTIVQALLLSLQQDVQHLQEHDGADEGRFQDILEQIKVLRNKLEHTPIGDGLTEAQVRVIVNELLVELQGAVKNLQEHDKTDDARFQDILAKLDKLIALPVGDFLTAVQVQTIVQELLLNLHNDLKKLQEHDEADEGRFQGILEQIKTLSAVPFGDFVTAVQVQTMVEGLLQKLQHDVQQLQGFDKIEEKRFHDILVQIKALRDKLEATPIGDGLTEAQVRAMVEALLINLQSEVKALQEHDGADEGRFQDILDQIKGLQDQLTRIPVGDGLTKAQVQTIVEALVLNLQTEIKALQEHDSADEGRFQNILTQIKGLQDQFARIPVGDGLTKVQVSEIVQQLVNALRIEVDTQTNTNKGRFSKIEADIAFLIEKLNNPVPGGTITGVSLQEMVTYVQGALKPLLEGIEAFRAFKEATANQFDVLAKEIVDLKAALIAKPPQAWKDEVVQAAIEAAVAKLPPLIAALQTENKSQQDLLTGLRTELNALQKQVTDWPASCTETEVDQRIMASLDELKKALDRTFTELNVRWKLTIEELNKQIVDGQAATNTHFTNLDTQWKATIQDFNKQITSLQTTTNTHFTTIHTEWEGTVQDLHKQIINLQTTTDVHFTTINTAWEGVIKSLRTEIEELEKNVQQVPTAEQIQALVLTALAKWQQEISDGIKALQHKDELLAKTDQELEKAIGGLQTQINDIHIPVKEVQEHVIQLTEWQKKVQMTLPELQSCCKDGKTKLHEIEEKVQYIQNDLDHSDHSNTGVRLARLCLLGRGIVGGLEIKSQDNDLINVSAGVGITPSGELLVESKSRTFNYYRPFAQAADYPFFSNNGKPYLVWELLEIPAGSKTFPEGAKSITSQGRPGLHPRFIEDKILILYTLNGQTYYLALRRDDVVRLTGLDTLLHNLLAQKTDTDYLYAETYSSEDNTPTEDDLCRAFQPVLLLPEIPLFRFGFRPDDECSPDDLDHPDFPDIDSFKEVYTTWIPIIDDALRQVDEVTQQVLDMYHPLLFPQEDIQEFRDQLNMLLEKWKVFQNYNEAHTPGTQVFIQYFYDWARDLIGAYHELRSGLQMLMADLSMLLPAQLDTQRRHLLLGPAERPVQNGLAAPLRDEFRQPPVYNGNADRLEASRLYFRRLFVLMRDFYLPDYLGENAHLDPFCRPGGHDDTEINKPDYSRIKITPGRSLGCPLSEQSIPFYYPVHSGVDSVHRYWHYRRSKTRSEDHLLCYHATDAEDMDSYTTLPEVIRPLYYTLDKYDFYRVEGHIGGFAGTATDKINVVELIQYYVKKYSLDFYVLKKTVSELAQAGGHNFDFKKAINQLEITQGFANDLLGMEHLSGVPKGGTLILVTEGDKIVADFSLPYRCCELEQTT